MPTPMITSDAPASEAGKYDIYFDQFYIPFSFSVSRTNMYISFCCLESTGTCSTSSIPCSDNNDCFVKQCRGGLRNGDICEAGADCPKARAGTCSGGTKEGLLCTTDDDCSAPINPATESIPETRFVRD